MILVVAAHPDDETLGAGATIARLAEREDVHLLVLTDGVRGRFPGAYTNLLDSAQHEYHRACLIREAECRAAADMLGIKDRTFARFFDQQLDVIPLGRITQEIERHLGGVRWVLTHGTQDLNQDHRRTCEAVRVATRVWGGSPILRVWGFKVDPNDGSQHALGYVEVDGSPVGYCHMAKLRNALACYKSELRESPHPTSLEVVEWRRRVWGAAAGVPFAEAFEVLQDIDRLPEGLDTV